MLSAQQELLGSLTIALPQPVEHQRRLLREIGASSLVRAARGEGVAGLLHANLKRAGLDDVLPPVVRRELEALYHRTAALNLQKQAALGALAARLADDGATVIVFKGMALFDTLYDDPGARATGDIDLRVDGRQREALVRALEAQGYRPEPFYPETYRNGNTAIDIHTHVLGTARVRSRAAILAAGEEPLLGETGGSSYGTAVRRLGAPQELLVAMLHLMKHNADRLLWLIEINELVAALAPDEWSALRELADRMQQPRSLQRVAYLADRLLPLTATTRLRDAAASAALPRFERRALDRRVTRGALPAWGPLWFFSTQRGVAARAATIFETLFPRPAVLRQVFGDADAGVVRLYLRRMRQLVGLALR